MFQRAQSEGKLLHHVIASSVRLSTAHAPLKRWLHSDVFGDCIVNCAAELCDGVTGGAGVGGEDATRADVINIVSLALTGNDGGGNAFEM